MKVIGTAEFSELLQTAPGINDVKFSVYPSNIVIGDLAIPLFFYSVDGVNYIVDHDFGKPPKLIEVEHPILDRILSSKQDLGVYGGGYFCTAVLRFKSLEESLKAHDKFDTLPLPHFVLASLEALQEAEWVVVAVTEASDSAVGRADLEAEVSKPESIGVSLIKFFYSGQVYIVVGKNYREEVMLELIRFDHKERKAYFSGIVAGKPIYQRVVLEEVTYRGDYDFLNWATNHDFENGETGHGLWWIRHMGVSLHMTSNSLTLRHPHLSVRGQVKEIPANYDTINNRTVIL
jgi:hypothetical protein